MNNEGNVLQLAEHSTTCPACGSAEVMTGYEVSSFPYGTGTDQVWLDANVPVISCDACGFESDGPGADMKRHQAVCNHLGVLTPDEVREVRLLHGLNRADFARLTGLGEASLNRWEGGMKIQNGSIDSLLYLLRDSKNIAALQSRRDEEAPGNRRFRLVERTDALMEKQAAFSL
ncbi:MAG: hypothetical protein AAF749_06100 [Pseudomonadota bacterium]